MKRKARMKRKLFKRKLMRLYLTKMRIKLLFAVCLSLVGVLPTDLTGFNMMDSQATVLWHADMEEGTLQDWEHSKRFLAGGAISKTSGTETIARTTDEVSHAGNYAAEATITNATRADKGLRTVELTRWTDKPIHEGGIPFPADAHYSSWVYIPHTYDVGRYDAWIENDNRTWWNLIQFKSEDRYGQNQQLWNLNLEYDVISDEMYFYLYSRFNSPHPYVQQEPVAIPIGEWFHIEMQYVQSPHGNGHIVVWQDGKKILEVEDVTTVWENPISWVVGNQTDQISGGPVRGSATVFYDDVKVSLGSVYANNKLAGFPSFSKR